MRDGPDSQVSTLPPDRLLASILGFWAFSFVLLLVLARTDLSREFFFDEAWRADLIRSTNPLGQMRDLQGFAPIPPLWVAILHLSSTVLPDSFVGLRVQGLVLASLLPALAAQLVRTIAAPHLDSSLRGRRDYIAGAAVAAVVAASLDSFGLVTYLNDYLFQGALVLAVLLAWYYVDQGWMRVVWMWPLLLMLAVGSIAGLFLLPVYAWWLVQSKQAVPASRRWAPLVASGVIASGVYLAFYRSQTRGGVQAYWSDHVLYDGATSLADLCALFLKAAGSLAFPSPVVDEIGAPTGVMFLALAMLGLREMYQWWPWIVRAALVAWFVAAAASIVVGWPVTPVRVNAPFLSIWIVAAAVGVWRFVALCFGRRLRASWLAFVVVVATVLVVNVVETPNSTPGAFARGLDEDLNPIRESRAPQLIVVAYHVMSKPYIHDGLVNEGASERYVFIQESFAGAQGMYENLDAQIETLQLVDGAEVWCVVPYDIGPDLSAQACRLDPAEFVEFYNERLNRAVVIGLRRAAGGT